MGSFTKAEGELLDVILDYLFRQEYKKGLERALQAQQLGDFPGALPGSQTSRLGYETYTLVGKVLTDTFSTNELEQLEENFKKSALFMQLLGAWGLALAYRKQGNEEKHNIYATFLRKKAPYCSGLALPEEPRLF